MNAARPNVAGSLTGTVRTTAGPPPGTLPVTTIQPSAWALAVTLSSVAGGPVEVVPVVDAPDGGP